MSLHRHPFQHIIPSHHSFCSVQASDKSGSVTTCDVVQELSDVVSFFWLRKYLNTI
ncbi:hypothetical protein RB213_004431 [Colletotrichum asianum]